jgi:N-acetylglucosaminyldiphosphoundecaprenol N-acetyl-beta-D-mannosaminyltransferase
MREAALRASAASPNYVWVGLGTPKQDLFMDVYSRFISAPMIGVGAAFDFEEGAVPVAPSWSHGRGIEWLFRLAAEPRRLARRYLIVSLAVIPSLVSALVRRIFRL